MHVYTYRWIHLNFVYRYSVQCNPGQILSYSVHAFDLEGKGICFGNHVCVDWVEITYNSLRTRERFCGSGEVNEVHVDGLNEITLEFSTNRQTEDRGFLYYIQCVDPGFDYNAVNSGLIPSLQAHLDPDVSCQPLQTQTMLTVSYIVM